MQGVVRKWGNSAAVRLPARFLEAAHLKIDQAVDIREEDGRVIITPLQSPPLSLETLVEAITDENRHEECHLGSPKGGEAW